MFDTESNQFRLQISKINNTDILLTILYKIDLFLFSKIRWIEFLSGKLPFYGSAKLHRLKQYHLKLQGHRLVEIFNNVLNSNCSILNSAQMCITGCPIWKWHNVSDPDIEIAILVEKAVQCHRVDLNKNS